MDASAAALVARRAYGFQSIDGTSLGWSSANLAICLSTLTALFDEHGSSLQLTSFYPLRLLLSSDEIQGKIDLYDGIIMLNPAATPLQWLQTLKNVSHDDIGKYKINQTRLKRYLEIVQNSLGIKLKKGHSCSSYDYHMFVERLAIGIENRLKEEGMVLSSQALALERVLVTVESSQACRRGVLNANGSIRVGADMTGEAVAASIARLSTDARKKVIKQADLLQTVKTNIGRAQEEFGFYRVYRAGLPKVTSEEVLTCLSTLLESTELDQLKGSLAGNSLGIAGSGHYCHLGDDGSIVVPWDWQTR
jgi:hypothetical protein|uniref:DUF4461 domain-containing protein n=1 Tax=Attheya septentrionalis TaxID=420275 RepID=A0A7S2UCY8_9STRA|mmetsp:Transcript_20287/g.36782  ORF Transcript_20287/g.36782 Transcript_20287/m.36782 type:complete len:306 (+) Transcript_20287:2-919(+)